MERELLSLAAEGEGWTPATQVEILLQYIENQQAADAFGDFLAGMRSDDLDV